MPARATASLTAAPPSFTAGRSLYPPPKRPMGVRAPSTITDEVMAALLSRSVQPFYGAGGAVTVLLDRGGRRERYGLRSPPFDPTDRFLAQVERGLRGLPLPPAQGGPD